MSATIDVMAVIDLHAKGLRHLGYRSAADELFKARAAVADLIEAARVVVERNTEFAVHGHQLLAAALARVHGGA
jgi:hypothetical protein